MIASSVPGCRAEHSARHASELASDHFDRAIELRVTTRTELPAWGNHDVRRDPNPFDGTCFRYIPSESGDEYEVLTLHESHGHTAQECMRAIDIDARQRGGCAMVREHEAIHVVLAANGHSVRSPYEPLACRRGRRPPSARVKLQLTSVRNIGRLMEPE